MTKLPTSLYSPSHFTFTRMNPIFHDLVLPYFRFEVDPITAGDQLQLIWGVWVTKDKDTLPDSVSAALYIDSWNDMIFQSEDVPLVVQGEYFYGTTDQMAAIDPPPFPVGNFLYTVPSVQLRLEVTFKSTGAVFTIEGTLGINSIAPIGWNWTGAQGDVDSSASTGTVPPLTKRFEFVINNAYEVLGRLTSSVTNRILSLSGSVTFLETPFGSSTSTAVFTSPFSLGPGSHADFVSNPIVKNWTWIIPSVWVRNPDEPLTKTFLYSVQIDCSDSYGNTYQDVITPQNLYIDVNVTNSKIHYGEGALGALGAAIIAAIFTFGAGAAPLRALASALGAEALDPPSPDPRYKALVPMPERTKISYNDKRFSEIVALIEELTFAMDLVQTLGAITNRLLGAQVAKDKKAIVAQQAGLRECRTTLRRASERLLPLAWTAIHSIEKNKAFDSYTIEQKLRSWQLGGIPNEARASLRKDGLTDETLAVLEAGLNRPEVVNFAKYPGLVLQLLAFSVVMALHQNASKNA